MGLFRRGKAFLRESSDMRELLNLPVAERPVVVYSEDTFTWNQLEGYVVALAARLDAPVAYVSSAADDPLHASSPPGVTTYYVAKLVPNLLPKIDSPVLFTTMPDIDSFHVKRPQQATVAYAFHSLNSIHMVYRPGAFDAYDVFFCTGPHHRRELEAHFGALGKPVDLWDVGYHKLDRIWEAHRTYRKARPGERTVLIAPSWGPGNVLESIGEQLVDELAGAGYRVVVRPHPVFFQRLYAAGAKVVAGIEKRFGGHPQVEIEKSIDTEDSFHEADLMISDWSGAAYEYAFGTERPVLFFDVPRKVFNPDWERLGITPFEDRMRSEVGRLLPTSEAGSAARHARELTDAAAEYGDRLRALRAEAVYNFGAAGPAGAAVLAELAGGS